MNDLSYTHIIHMTKERANAKPRYFVVIKQPNKKEILERDDLGIRAIGFWTNKCEEGKISRSASAKIKAIWLSDYRIDYIESLMFRFKS